MCKVTNENFFYPSYVVNVTPSMLTVVNGIISSVDAPAIPAVSSVNNQIIVTMYNPNGVKTQRDFYITVYKP